MMKTCTKCGCEKSLIENFSKSKTHAGGYSTWCKACHKVRRSQTQSKYYQDKEKWRLENRERYSDWRREFDARPEQRQKAKARTKRWNKNNQSRAAALWASMKEARRVATPSWVNMHLITFFYATRDYMNQETETEWHVDHIVPIKGKLVCGLHVHTNLRVITATENMRKRNNFEVA